MPFGGRKGSSYGPREQGKYAARILHDRQDRLHDAIAISGDDRRAATAWPADLLRRQSTSHQRKNSREARPAEAHPTQHACRGQHTHAAASTLLSRTAGAQSFRLRRTSVTPRSAVQILDPGLRSTGYSGSTVEQIATGMRWAEACLFPTNGGYLFSDTPSNRILKFRQKTEPDAVFRSNANYASNGARPPGPPRQLRRHSVTRRITRTEKDGKITVLADKFEGKRLNAPNDIVVRSDDFDLVHRSLVRH